MRDDLWLTNRLVHLWQNYFSDITHGNELKICFGRKSKTRLGSIAIREKGRENSRLTKNHLAQLGPDRAISIITINSHLSNSGVPEEIVDAVIAHEFCHFVHGFNSMREQRFDTPHAGGIIHRELEARGLEHLIKIQKKWIKENWKQIAL